MLNRTAVSTPLPRARGAIGGTSIGGALRQGLYAGPNAWLKQLVLIFAIACALTCVYLWQSSAIAALQKDTNETQRALKQLERENVALMLQVAQRNSPSYIQERARRSGLITERAVMVLEVPLPMATPPAGAAVGDAMLAEATAWWRFLMAEIVNGAATAGIAPAVAR